MPDLNNPVDALTRGTNLLGLLGSFWTSLYTGSGIVGSYTDALNQSFLQTYRDLMELIACACRFTVPIYHRQNWSILRFNKSQKLAGQLLSYGSGADFGNNYAVGGVNYYFGVSPYTTSDYPAPTNLIDVSVIVNRISEPSVTLIKGIDFVIDTTIPAIRFRDDPFNNPLIPTIPVYDQQGNLIDSQINLWLFMGDYDWKLVHEQFGYVLNLYLQSSANYRSLVNLVFDAIVGGSVYSQLETLFAILTDTQPVIETHETVQDIVKDPIRQIIITDQHVYKFSLSANPIVTVGQILKAGDKLVDAFQIFQYRDIPSAAQIPALAVGTDVLVGSFNNDLVFQNAQFPLQVTVDQNTRTRIQFQLGGTNSDIQTFWNTVHTNGTKIGGVSLAQLLDKRYPPAQSPDPLANNLPATINPLLFLMQNVLRNNAIIVVFNTASFGPNALGTNSPKSFRQVIPPQNLVFILVQIKLNDSVPMSDSGSTLHTGYSEGITPGSFKAPDPLTELDPSGFVGSETFSFTMIPG